MPIGTSDGEYFDSHFDSMVDKDFNPNLKKVYIGTPGKADVEDRSGDSTLTLDMPTQFEKTFGMSPHDALFDYPAGSKTRNPLAKDLGYEDIKKPSPVDTLEFINNVENMNDPWKGGTIPRDQQQLLKDGIEPFFSKLPPAPGMPSGSPTEPAGAFNFMSGSQTPDEGQKVRFKTSSPLVNITDEDINTAINVGMGAGPGTMMGVTSKTFGKAALAEAQTMEAAGAHPEDIWHATGNYKGVDGRWRQEINDSAAKIKPDATTLLEGTSKEIPDDIRMAHVLQHRDLYDAYPWVQNIKVRMNPKMGNNAVYDELQNTVRIGPKALSEETLLHEIQHAIQGREGFAKGGSAAEKFALKYEKEVEAVKQEGMKFLQKDQEGIPFTQAEKDRIQIIRQILEKDKARRALAPQKAFENYQKLAGEVEARNTETRMILDAMGRRKFFPEWTQDTKNADQLVHDKPMWTTPYGSTDNPMRAPSQ